MKLSDEHIKQSIVESVLRQLNAELLLVKEGQLDWGLPVQARSTHVALGAMEDLCNALLSDELGEVKHSEVGQFPEQIGYVGHQMSQAVEKTLDQVSQAQTLLRNMENVEGVDALQKHLQEIVLAQSYQDLSGQIIQGLERQFAHLQPLLVCLTILIDMLHPETEEARNIYSGCGPSVSGGMDQDDIDNLFDS